MIRTTNAWIEYVTNRHENRTYTEVYSYNQNEIVLNSSIHKEKSKDAEH